MGKYKYIKRLIPATCAWVLLLSTTALFFIFPCRRLHEEYHYSITIAQAIITFFVISNLFATTFVDPGIIRKAQKDEDKGKDVLFIDATVNNHRVRLKWCPTCEFYRPPRCSHCSVCDNCIEKFDHHCPWVNNCIGRRNYRHFFFFLIFLTIHMVTIFIWCLLFVINNRNKLQETDVVVAIVLIVIIVLFFIPIVGLTCFHIVLVARGRTTNEQVTKKFNRQVNPYSENCLKDCCYTLCGPRYPRLYDPKRPPDICYLEYAEFREHQESRQTDEQEKTIDDGFNYAADYAKSSLLNDVNPMVIVQSNANNKSSKRSDSSSYSDGSSSSQNNPHSEPLKIGFRKRNSNDEMFPLNGINEHDSGHIVTKHTENGTKETTFIALNSASSSPPGASYSSSTSNMFSPHQQHHPHHHHHYPHHTNKISATKSSSINEISSRLHHPPINRSPLKSHQLQNYNNQQQHQYHPLIIGTPQHQFQGKQQGPEGGMLIYYSPDAAPTSKFNSESELENFRKSQQKQQPHYLQYIDDDSDLTSMLGTGGNNKNRPMPFQKALEISNKLEQQFSSPKNKNNKTGTSSTVGTSLLGSTTATATTTTTTASNNNNNNRQSQYEMNYEISV